MDDCCASADYGRMTNVLVAPTWGPSASGIKHFRARHLVVGLAELFVEYGRHWTARQIYEEWLSHDVILHKLKRFGSHK